MGEGAASFLGVAVGRGWLVRLVVVGLAGSVVGVVPVVVTAPAAAASTYEDLVLGDSPVAYWRLGDSGSSLADASGNGNGATITGGVTTGASGALVGDSDTAVTLNDSTGYATAAAAASLNSPSA